jgi:iron(III) transport system ATP-binding protein
MNSILSVSSISKKYEKQNVQALNNVSFECDKGEIVSVVGSSGSGKSTLLKLISGLEIPDIGEIILKGTIINNGSIFVPPEERDCDLVFQDFSLFPNMTINENIYFGKNAHNNKSMIDELIALTDISDILSRYPHQISGGQQQRTALVRALANNPALLLMDEPLSHLDSGLKENVRNELITILKKLEMTVIIVTHDSEDALVISDKTIVLNSGNLEQLDTPKNIYQYPKSEYAARLFGKTNIVPLKLIPGVKHFFTQASTGREVVSIRPHQFILQRDENLTSLPEINGTIRNIIDSGHRWIVEIEHKDALFCAEIENNNSINIGDKETFYINLN